MTVALVSQIPGRVSLLQQGKIIPNVSHACSKKDKESAEQILTTEKPKQGAQIGMHVIRTSSHRRTNQEIRGVNFTFLVCTAVMLSMRQHLEVFKHESTPGHQVGSSDIQDVHAERERERGCYFNVYIV